MPPGSDDEKGIVVALLIFSLAYGYGAAMEANVLLDHSPEEVYIAHVEGKRIVRGKSKTYELDLGAWGPIMKSNKLRVTRATYDAIEHGDVVDLISKPGALGVKWYFMRPWRRAHDPGAEAIAP
jgi:hypothetical protein